MLLPLAGGSNAVVTLGELMMILDLHRQGLTISAIARQLGIDRKTVRRYIDRGLEPPAYGPRPPRQRSTDPFLPYLRERLTNFPGLTSMRLWRGGDYPGYNGGYKGGGSGGGGTEEAAAEASGGGVCEPPTL